MKKLLLFLAGFTAQATVFGQILLTETDFANQSDTVRLSQTADPVIDYTLTGQDYNWDFSQLVPASQYLKDFQPISLTSFTIQAVYGSFAASDYRATYSLVSRDLPLDQLNQLLPVTLSDLKAYYKRMTDSITQVGYSVAVNGTAIPFKSDTIETRYFFPLNYGDTSYTRGYTYIDLNPATDVKTKQHRSVRMIVDGFGTLVTPYSTYPVLRLKREIEEIDSVYQTFFGTGTWFATPATLTTEYEWLTTTGLDAVLKIVETTSNGNTQVRSVEYQDIYRGMDAGLSDLSFQASVYPNPTSGMVSIKAENYVNQIEIKDLDGRIIRKMVSNSMSPNVDLSDFHSGIYFVALFAGSQTTTLRVIKD